MCTSESVLPPPTRWRAAGRLHEIVAVVIDEFHSVGADARGVCLEGTVAKLLLHTRRAVAVSSGCSSCGVAPHDCDDESDDESDESQTMCSSVLRRMAAPMAARQATVAACSSCA